LSLPKKSTPKLPEFQVSASYLFLACCWSKIILGTNIMANQDFLTQFCKTSFFYHLYPDFVLPIASQEFHLKTLERAMQHTSALSSSLLNCNDSDKVIIKLIGYLT
jgi:hypothetical protein